MAQASAGDENRTGTRATSTEDWVAMVRDVMPNEAENISRLMLHHQRVLADARNDCLLLRYEKKA